MDQLNKITFFFDKNTHTLYTLVEICCCRRCCYIHIQFRIQSFYEEEEEIVRAEYTNSIGMCTI